MYRHREAACSTAAIDPVRDAGRLEAQSRQSRVRARVLGSFGGCGSRDDPPLERCAMHGLWGRCGRGCTNGRAGHAAGMSPAPEVADDLDLRVRMRVQAVQDRPFVHRPGPFDPAGRVLPMARRGDLDLIYKLMNVVKLFHRRGKRGRPALGEPAAMEQFQGAIPCSSVSACSPLSRACRFPVSRPRSKPCRCRSRPNCRSKSCCTNRKSGSPCRPTRARPSA